VAERMVVTVNDNIAQLVGERIRARRKALGLKQREIAQALGIEQSEVSRWERGVHEPRGKNRARLCDVLGVTVDYLYRRPEENDHPEAA
jgi:transcriptional regulator with XRE-family HTH domain